MENYIFKITFVENESVDFYTCCFSMQEAIDQARASARAAFGDEEDGSWLDVTEAVCLGSVERLKELSELEFGRTLKI